MEGLGRYAASGDALGAFATKTTESMTPRMLAIMAMLIVAKELFEQSSSCEQKARRGK